MVSYHAMKGASMTAVQMNVRIEKNLKREGDEAFEDIGYTPTEVVREMWGFAQRNRHKRCALVEMMDALRDPRELAGCKATEEHELAEFERLLGAGHQQIEEICANSGIDLAGLAPLDDGGYDQLLAEAYDEEIRHMWGTA